MENKNLSIKISTGTIVRTILVLLLIFFVYKIRDIAALILFSVVIASGVEPAAAWFQKRKVSRVLAVIFVYLIIFSVLGLVFYLVVPTLFSQLSDLSDYLPSSYLNRPIEKQIVEALPTLPESVSVLLLEFVRGAKDYIETIAGGFFSATTSLFGGALAFFMVFVLSFYLSVQENGIESFLRIILPVHYEDYVIDLWLRTRKKLGAWMKGQLLLSLILGVLVYLSLTIIGLKYALILALLAAVFELIPVFGPIISGIPAVAIALLQSPTMALAVAALYVVIHQFENHLIYPLVIRKVVGVPPILTILALIIGGKLAGFMGILLSMPIVTILVEISNDYDKKKRPVTEAVDIVES